MLNGPLHITGHFYKRSKKSPTSPSHPLPFSLSHPLTLSPSHPSHPLTPSPIADEVSEVRLAHSRITALSSIGLTAHFLTFLIPGRRLRTDKS